MKTFFSGCSGLGSIFQIFPLTVNQRPETVTLLPLGLVYLFLCFLCKVSIHHLGLGLGLSAFFPFIFGKAKQQHHCKRENEAFGITVELLLSGHPRGYRHVAEKLKFGRSIEVRHKITFRRNITLF